MTERNSELTSDEMAAEYTWLTEIDPEVEYQKRLDAVLKGMVEENLISSADWEATFERNKYLVKANK